MTAMAVISSDIDTLESIYKGQGCTRADGYTYDEFEVGLENFARFLEQYNAPATLFMVGQDFLREKSHPTIHEMVQRGYEIANHTHTHTQGFGHLRLDEMEYQLLEMERACIDVTGIKPIGFRSPGWNVTDRALPLLKKHGYQYESSVFPTTMMPLLKFLHWSSMSDRQALDRTTMGQFNYMFAPIQPYQCAEKKLGRRGQNGLKVFPVTVTPTLRIPFFATFLLSTGIDLFRRSYTALKNAGFMIQFQFHLSDFVDYTQPLFVDQVPQAGKGQYVPKALMTPLDEKYQLFKQAIDIIAEDYTFTTLKALTESSD